MLHGIIMNKAFNILKMCMAYIDMVTEKKHKKHDLAKQLMSNKSFIAKLYSVDNPFYGELTF